MEVPTLASQVLLQLTYKGDPREQANFPQPGQVLSSSQSIVTLSDPFMSNEWNNLP